jgi:hypothetical protein
MKDIWISLTQAAHIHDLTLDNARLLADAENWRESPNGGRYDLNDVRDSIRRSPETLRPSWSVPAAETGRDE